MPPKKAGIVKTVVNRVKAAWNALRGKSSKKMPGAKKSTGKKKMGGGGGSH